MCFLKSRDELLDGVDCIEALRIRIGNGLAVGHLVVGIEFNSTTWKGMDCLPAKELSAQEKEAPYGGGLRASKLQLL